MFDYKDEIEYAYYETEKSLTLAELNLETAKTSPINVLNECQEMLDDIKQDYIKYKEKISILKLMDLFNKEVNTYDELLSKRKNVNELFRHIKNEEFLEIVMSTVTKQYNTILMEQQDVNTYNDLTVEKNRKMEVLTEINEENNSEKFREILEELIKNEEARQARILEEQKKIEEEEKKRKLELERKKQEEILKRQKIIEEARKKEMEKRTKELLEQQQRSVLQTKRRESGISFETIKDISDNKDNKINVEEKEIKKNEIIFEDNKIEEKNNINEDVLVFKDKVDIEKELFDEFNNDSTEYELNLDKDLNLDFNIDLDEEKKHDDKKLPDISIDEYMKNFDETEFEKQEVNSLFSDDDIFPSIPM